MRDQRGLTLLELLLSTFIIAMVLSLLYVALNAGLKIFSTELLVSDISVEALKAMDRMEDELREATEIITPETQSLCFNWKDQEIATYSWSGIPDDKLLRTSATSTITLAHNVWNFELAYDSLPNVKLINLSLTIKKDTQSKTLNTYIRPRNL